MQNPPPPSQAQAEEAQQARFAAEAAILTLFVAAESGGGDGDDDSPSVRAIQIALILKALSGEITYTSFRHLNDRTLSLLSAKPDHEQIAERVLPEAQRVFKDLVEAELNDEQRAVVWATWAYSKTADVIAEDLDSGKLLHQFSEQGLKLKKIWISRSDARVRPLHAKLHGKAIPSSEDFWRWPHSGERLRWPGDAEAPMDTTIGCRCVCLLTWANQDEVSETIKKITGHTRSE